MAYKLYKPIGVATTGQAYIPPAGNLSGVIAATDSRYFIEEFIAAVSKQRFWDRTFVEASQLQPAGV